MLVTKLPFSQFSSLVLRSSPLVQLNLSHSPASHISAFVNMLPPLWMQVASPASGSDSDSEIVNIFISLFLYSFQSLIRVSCLLIALSSNGGAGQAGGNHLTAGNSPPRQSSIFFWTDSVGKGGKERYLFSSYCMLHSFHSCSTLYKHKHERGIILQTRQRVNTSLGCYY